MKTHLNTKIKVFMLAAAALLAAVVGCESNSGSSDSSGSTSVPASSNPANYSEPGPSINIGMNEPDKYAWELFLKVNTPAADETRDTKWETWAEQDYIYKFPCGPAPVWPGGPQTRKGGKSNLAKGINAHSNSIDPFIFLTDTCYLQEVKVNRPMFDYIAENGLHNQDGVFALASTKGIDFPKQSTVVKADWKPIGQKELDRYHWAVFQIDSAKSCSGTFSEGRDTFGLTALHVVDKSLPTWFWSTFEHVDNLGRCDDIGCRDNFGQSPHFTEPHETDGDLYAPEKLTPELEEMFATYGVDPIFKNYRLKGTMVNFTDSKGDPYVLGSSVLEPGFVSSSSCMTCHAMATVAEVDDTLGSLGFFESTKISLGLGPNREKGITVTGYTGAPDPDWYEAGKNNSEYYQVDFMWQLMFVAEACDPNTVKQPSTTY